MGRTSSPGLIVTRLGKVYLDQPEGMSRQRYIDYRYGGVCVA